MKKNAPIGIFDSGLGGLAVLREVRRLLPHEDVVFLGDTARQPSGPQPVESVRQYAIENTAYLAPTGAKLVIIACNTASVAGREASQACFPDLPVLGMIGPGVRAALAASQHSRIGVWGTRVTVDSKAYDQRILEAAPNVEVKGVACPDLLRRQVTLIGSWTFSTVRQAECAQFIAERGIDVDALFTDRWRLEQGVEAYQHFDRQTAGKGVFVF